MSSNRDIKAAALIVLRQHGGSAGYYAASRADELEDQGSHEGARKWRQVLKAIEELQAMEPKGPVN